MEALIENSEAAIWNRVVDLDAGDLVREAAESLLRIRLAETDLARVNQLAEKAREGSLTSVEEAELANYGQVGRVLELIKSKARRSLKSSGNSV